MPSWGLLLKHLKVSENLKGAEKKRTLQKHPFGQPFLRERPRGVKNSGGWKPYRKFGEKPLPKSVFGPPTYDTAPTRPTLISEASKSGFGEHTLQYVSPPPKFTRYTFPPPSAAAQVSLHDAFAAPFPVLPFLGCVWISLVNFKQGIPCLNERFPCISQGFRGFGRSRKSLVNLRFFLEETQIYQAKEGQGKARPPTKLVYEILSAAAPSSWHLAPEGHALPYNHHGLPVSSGLGHLLHFHRCQLMFLAVHQDRNFHKLRS